MSKKDKHKPRGALYGKFCTVAVYKKKCECSTPNDYRENTEQPWGDPFQAHHLAPIAVVEAVIVGNSDLRSTVENTPWCINKALNMYALPVWGHTVKHYCRKTKAFYQKKPGFKNRPQHSNDHGKYSDEVAGMLQVATDEWEQHDVTESNISGLLDNIAKTMKARLVQRGSSRKGGTHNAWLNAVEASEQGKEFEGWYEPFSMALKPTERGFPIKGESSTVNEWINMIQKAMTA